MSPPTPAKVGKLKEGNKVDIINHRQYGFSRDCICGISRPRKQYLAKSASVFMFM